MEPTKDSRTTLKDVINYQPDQYMSKEELDIIKNTFKYNPQLINILRKIMIPTIMDPSLPIESMGNDAFNAGRDWAAIPADEAKILAVARQDALQFVIGGLIKLKVLSNLEEDTPEQQAERAAKDSAR